MSWNSILKSAFGIAALSVAVGAQAGSNSARGTVVPEKVALGASEDVHVNVTLTNTSSSPYVVCRGHVGHSFDTFLSITRLPSNENATPY